jgi:hypothetical protein
MGRQAKLRRKGEYWATDAGGKTTCFGRTNEVPYGDALKRFRKFLAVRSVAEPQVCLLTKGKTVWGLFGEFSNWMQGTETGMQLVLTAIRCSGSWAN